MQQEWHDEGKDAPAWVRLRQLEAEVGNGHLDDYLMKVFTAEDVYEAMADFFVVELAVDFGPNSETLDGMVPL